MADKNSERAAKIASASKRGKDIDIRSSYMSLIDMINTRGDEYPSTAHLDSFNHCNTWHNIDFNKLNARYNVLPPLRLVPVSGGDRTCHWRPDTLFIYTDALNAGLRFPFHPFIPHLLADLQINPCQLPPNAWRNILCFMVCCLREGFPLSVAVFRKVFQCYNSSSNICGWVYVKQRPKSKHIFNSASIPDNNQNWRNSFVGLRWENGDWGTLFRSSFGKVSDGSLKSIHLTPEETIIYNGLTQDDGSTTSWTLLEEFSLIHVGLSSVSQQAAKEINEDNVPLVEETARMKKARLAGLDTRGKATEPIFLKKHKEPIGEASTEGAGGHGTPITAAAPTAAATGAFQPLWGFRRGDTVVGSTKHAWDWSYHSVTPKDFTDVVATPDLERIKLMGAQSLASSNAYFQGAVRQAESWKRASDKADNALRRQQKKYATLEKKLKRKEEELGESNAELVGNEEAERTLNLVHTTTSMQRAKDVMSSLPPTAYDDWNLTLELMGIMSLRMNLMMKLAPPWGEMKALGIPHQLQNGCLAKIATIIISHQQCSR
ncbi:uncharacterized protein LOC141674523 [Apium graveolens]|uniref:uncharacterized protein LOC141674523 n=1 Tax=Apium graveolens TaxID=4045 RepID=UPI003D7C098E